MELKSTIEKSKARHIHCSRSYLLASFQTVRPGISNSPRPSHGEHRLPCGEFGSQNCCCSEHPKTLTRASVPYVTDEPSMVPALLTIGSSFWCAEYHASSTSVIDTTKFAERNAMKVSAPGTRRAGIGWKPELSLYEPFSAHAVRVLLKVSYISNALSRKSRPLPKSVVLIVRYIVLRNNSFPYSRWICVGIVLVHEELDITTFAVVVSRIWSDYIGFVV